MNDIHKIIDGLSNTPDILVNMVRSIPNTMVKKKRIPTKWTIHEHVCHLAQAELMILARFSQFKGEEAPKIEPYLPGKNVPTDDLINLDLENQVEEFCFQRGQTVELINRFDANDWRKKATHVEYHEYGAYIFLRHVLMHDHFHLYRIEELWLTKQEFLKIQ